MNGASTFFLILSGLLALVGFSAAGSAVELGLSLFGFLLLAFGLGFAFFTIKHHYDMAEAAARRRHGHDA
ncbi:hypothetical protein M0638_10265 [Roseomonas sp. NAR14]|uniref:Uncharacterized protein n=1 Tax=Roseomonas acroporae TaxID=2937791 RepID=A0A9X2BV65_9PROT|nr:hypothetical protein [Roseomonas acroporae]MCK8784766.1 hypothetical protein [Roseomonas acroporae]